MKARQIILAVGLSLALSTSHAVLLGKNFESSKESETTKLYITGIGEGIRIASIIGELKGLPPIFCSPKDSSLDAEDYFRIFEAKYYSLPKEMREAGPIEPMVYAALQQEFPCAE